MGEVYRARDAKLNRDVALKILSDSFVTDPNRLARFRREAQVLASLSHPNIAAIYGFEDSGTTHALVLELVEGATLADRIEQDPIALADALSLAKQIAEALEAAHELGIVHRDLKPANIKIRADGTVKVLDFGLAKSMDLAAGSSADATNFATLTSPVMTQVGMILGTAAYMAPEQARGRVVDKRADVWAFGAVLFEMLTGARAFPGDDLTDTLASGATFDTRRLSQAVSAQGPETTHSRHGRDAPRARGRVRHRRAANDDGDRVGSVTALDGVGAGRDDRRVACCSRLRAVEPARGRSANLGSPTISLQPGSEITSAPAITSDGRTVAYVAREGTEDSQLYLRDLTSFEARTVPGSKGARQPFFSPDGKWVGFFAQGQLQKAEVAGGAPVLLAEATYPFGGTWTEDNTIIYATSLGSGLLQIPASGGAPKSISKPDGAANGYAHVWPQALPAGRSGRRVLFTIWGRGRRSTRVVARRQGALLCGCRRHDGGGDAAERDVRCSAPAV
jgi:serine/threonine protein kinase